MEGAVGNVGGRADLMGSGQIVADEAPSTEELVASGHEIARDNAFAVYFYKKQIIVAFEKSLKQVKKTISCLVTVTGDKWRSTNEWKRVQYVLTSKPKVQVNGEFAPLKDAMGKAIQHVCGATRRPIVRPSSLVVMTAQLRLYIGCSVKRARPLRCFLGSWQHRRNHFRHGDNALTM